MNVLFAGGEKVSDLISRQAAIDAVEKLYLPQTKGETAAEEINRVAWRCALNCAEEMIGHLPSAQPERKKGKWIGKPLAGYCTVRCSVCNDAFIENSGKWNFCPNCGARMRGEDETD